MENEKKPTRDGVEKYFATEVVEQSKRTAKRWFIAWVITFAALIGTNALWIYQWNSYDYIYQDSHGTNNINTGTQGDINEPESEN